MANTCHSSLKIYGDPAHAPAARKLVGAIFGPCLHDDANPFLKKEAASPPLLVVRIESIEVPPVSLVQELSEKLPDLEFVLLWNNYLGGRRGHRKYVAGKVADAHREEYRLEREADSQPTPSGEDAEYAAFEQWKHDVVRRAKSRIGSRPSPSATHKHDSGGPSSPVARPFCTKATARLHLERCFELVRKQLLTGAMLDQHDQSAMDEDFRTFKLLRLLLDEGDQFHLDQLAEQYKRRAEDLRAQLTAGDKVLTAIGCFEDPAVAAVLTADDWAALNRLGAIGEKLQSASTLEM